MSVPNGDWCIDFHQRFDYSDAVRACRLIEEYEPYFVEDPVRDEHAHQDLPKLRQMTTVPLTHGEEWGQRYDFNKLVENHDIDYIRATLPNVGGITEMMKIAAMCETHAVGIIPHFTGPIATAALGELPLDVSRSGHHGVQLWRPPHRLLAPMSRFQGWEGAAESTARIGNDSRDEIAHEDRRSDSARPEQRLHPS